MLSTEALRSHIPRNLFNSICSLFNDSQHHNTTHRKNIQSLKKLHAESIVTGTEEHFFCAFLHCLHVLLSLKKGEDAAPRLLRFAVGFIVVLTAEKSQSASIEEGVGRFVENLMMYLLEHVDSKDKTVRARLCQLMVACVNGVDELSDGVWNHFRAKMIERLFDKEASVRVQAVHATARLQGLQVDESLSIRDIFVDLLDHDPSPEVRKAVLTQIDVTRQSLPCILNRRRDLDVSVRRYFFTSKLQEIDVAFLAVEQRDAILQSGLHDRDEQVRKACIDVLFGAWLHRANSNLVELVACLDVVADPELGESVMGTFFSIYPSKLFPENCLPDGYFENLTVETVFILKMYCRHIGEEADSLLPDVAKLVETLARFYQYFLSGKEVRPEVEFVMKQVLQLLSMKDMSEEAGRKAVIEQTETMLSNIELSDALYSECIQLHVKAHASVEEAVENVTRLVIDFRDYYSTTELTEDSQVLAQLKCLALIQQLLVVPELDLSPEGYLWAVLNEIVIPAVNSQLAVVQEAGLRTLGLYCTLSDTLTSDYQSLLYDFVKLAVGSVRVEALKALFDLVLLRRIPTEEQGNLLHQMTATLYDKDEEVQAIAAEGFAKLLLHQAPLCNPLEVLEGLLTLYHLASQSNTTVAGYRRTQCLAYFVQAFCFSKTENQRMLRATIVKFFTSMCALLEGEDKKCALVFAHLLFLSDPQNLVTNASNQEVKEYEEEGDSWEKIAVELAWAVVDSANRPYAKQLSAALSKIPLTNGGPLIQELILVLSHAIKALGGSTVLGKVLATATALPDTHETVLEDAIVLGIRKKLNQIAPMSTISSAPPVPLKKKVSTSKSQNASIMPNLLEDLDDLIS